jgi:antitoxin component YwqK of YwqJK toxin-antitoxin module
MKKYMIIGAVLISGMFFAQTIEPKLEAMNQKVKVTYYFEDGTVQQEGFFENGKLDGQWVSFDSNGNKKSIGEYNKGVKCGKWLFWNDATLTEVEFSKSKIESIQNWKKDALAKY